MRLSISIAAGFAMAFCLAAPASATITTQDLWHMGEDGRVNPTDSVGGKTINDGFSTTINSLHAPTSSTSSLHYNGFAGNYIDGDSTGATYVNVPADNWALELWVNPSSFGSGANIASLGTTSSTVGGGWAKIGLSGSGDFYFARENESYGPLFHNTAVNTWFQVSYVQMNGVIHGYVNGVEAGSYDNATASRNNSGQIHLGVEPGGGQNLDGYIDDVRFSTFAPGAFSTRDLLYYQAVPEPAMWAAFGLGALAVLRRRRA